MSYSRIFASVLTSLGQTAIHQPVWLIA
ncbi:hypothetical protein PMIN01_03200 [Paraphaeosphaeria minitans]|uniref:Uncharacterized protein n=1 Tax=Paraphaeosphaeria minitans TaxID=565426 RepID=A0A9P6KT32_9PLEO|nr:hypothetical protein PMIN01_03200 [Paraphaeosphaeria minitans]